MIKKIAILGHIRPDGDCVGSCLALKNYIEETAPGAEVKVFLGDFSESFLMLKGANEILHNFETEEVFDLCVSLDASDRERLGDGVAIFDAAKQTICIDHHITNMGFAQENIIDAKASSTSELLFTLLDKDKISKETAACLYMGIVHDTGVFRHSNTTKKTMEAAGFLVDKGIPFSEIIDETFYKKTYVQNQILGRALMESVLFFGGRCVFTRVTEKDMKFYGVTAKDLDGIVDQLRVTDGVEVAIFFYETAPQVYKVSMRANGDVNVAKVAQYFGGGGHIKAAGCTMSGSLHDVINNLSEQIAKQLETED